MDPQIGNDGPATHRKGPEVLRGRAARRLFVALGGGGYVLLRHRRNVIRTLEQVMDVVPLGWGAAVAFLLLGLAVWLMQRGREVLPERKGFHGTSMDSAARTFDGSARRAHMQLAARALLVAALLAVLLRIASGGPGPAALLVMWLSSGLTYFAYLELRLRLRGGRQSVRLDRDGVTVRNRRSRQVMGWDQIAEVTDPLGKDGIILKGSEGTADVRIGPEGHGSKGFSRMVVLIEDRLARSGATPGLDTRRGARRQAWAWAGTFALGAAAVAFVEVSIGTWVMTAGSMEDTLLVGDFVLATPVPEGFDPDPGAILIFEAPHQEGTELVKRVVGVPGDTLEMRDKALYRNGTRQDKPYVSWRDPAGDDEHPWMEWQEDHLLHDPEGEEYRPSRDHWGPIVVPEDRFFMLGDNRDLSLDSRYWGLVDREQLSARPRFIYFSYDRQAPGLVTFLREARWDRVGRAVAG